MPSPKVYRGPAASGEEDIDGEVDSPASTTPVNARDAVDRDSNAVASSGVPSSDVVSKTLTESQADGDCVETAPSNHQEHPGSTLADSSTTDDSMLTKGAVTTHNQCVEGVGDPLLQNHRDAASCLSKCETCDVVVRTENIKLSGDAGSKRAVCEHCKELDGDSDKSAAVENPISVPISIPGSNIAGVVNGGNCMHLPRQLGSISEGSQPPTALTSDEVGGGGAAPFSSFCGPLRKSLMSQPRFTPSGSFIIPADEDIYVDYSCGLFSTEACHTSGVLDLSALPSPPSRPFTIGDHEETGDLTYFSPNESVASALTQSCRSFRPHEILADTGRHHSDTDISKHDSASPADIKVEMIDATSREVLDEIFKRTSSTFASVFFLYIYLCIISHSDKTEEVLTTSCSGMKAQCRTNY